MERTYTSPKTKEATKNNNVSKTPKTNFSQSLNSPVGHILNLQRTIGNQSVQGLFKSGAIQAKLRIGQSLSDSSRAYFEPRFGADFSGVRVHTGSDTARMSSELNAQAFTLGRDVYFGSGRYGPGTSSGKRLLAHELTHVIQQTHGFDTAASIRKSRGFYIAPLECGTRSNCSTSLEQRDCYAINCGVGGSGTCRWGGPGARCCRYGSRTTEIGGGCFGITQCLPPDPESEYFHQD